MQQTPSRQFQTEQTRAIEKYRAGKFQDALIHAQNAAELDPGNTGILNLVGAIAIQSNDNSTAIQYLQKSIDINKDQQETHYLSGIAFSALDLHEDAIKAFEYTFALNPVHVNAMTNMGVSLQRSGNFDKAERAYRRALEIDPDHAEANNALGDILYSRTRYDKALECTEIAVASQPDKIEFILNHAKILRRLNRFKEAEELNRAALKIHPHDASLLIELGGILREQNLIDAAKEHYKHALKMAPNNLRILQSTGAFYQSIRQPEEAVKYLKKYVTMKPNDPGMLNNYAISLRDIGKYEKAEKFYLKSAEKSSTPSFAYNNLAILAMEMNKPVDSITYYRKALEYEPHYAGARSNMLFYMNYSSDFSTQKLYEEHLYWDKLHNHPILDGADVHGNDPSTDRKLRIGYITSDFYGHAVSYFIEPALKNHDKENFKIYCYASVRSPDGITERLQSYGHNWRSILNNTTEEIVELIREDKIDILVDLSGHTAGNKLLVMVRKPAPVQVTWIGYPNTTGLGAIDYRFVDDITDPVGEADKHHSETLFRLPKSFTCFNPQTKLPCGDELDARTSGHITYGSFNNASKISTASIEVWSRILKKVKNSRLYLKSGSLQDKGTVKRLKKKFHQCGITNDQLFFFGSMPSTEHLRFYDQIDICLDPFPYNGTTTSCEALWMGVPIIALLGDRHAARVTASLITQVGLDYLVAIDVDDYVEKAAWLASDLDRLHEIRKNLRENMRTSPLCDQVAHTRGVEEAYRTMWKKWSDEEPTRRKQRKKLGRSQTKPLKPNIGLVHALTNQTFVQFCKCLGAMKDSWTLSDMHPLGMNITAPLPMAQKRYSFFDKDEWKILTERPKDFKEAMTRVHNLVSRQNGHLIIECWSHLDYIALPFMAAPSYEQFTSNALKEIFTVQELYITRHPLAQWLSYCKETNVPEHITIEEFLRGYRNFARHAKETTYIRCEDFADKPDNILKQVCKHLEIPFDPDYKDVWPFNRHVSGDGVSRTLEQRASEVITAPLPTDVDPDLLSRIKGNPDYLEILEILDYDPCP